MLPPKTEIQSAAPDTYPDPSGFQALLRHRVAKGGPAAIPRLLVSSWAELRTLTVDDWCAVWPIVMKHANTEELVDARQQFAALPAASDPRLTPYLDLGSDPLVLALWCALHAPEDASRYLPIVRLMDEALYEAVLREHPSLVDAVGRG